MIDVVESLKLRDLFNKDLSISEIARQTGHSRVTMRKYLNSQVPPLNPEAIPKAEQTGEKGNSTVPRWFSVIREMRYAEFTLRIDVYTLIRCT